MRIGKKFQHLLEDQDIKRWYENLARGSQSTADVRLRGLGRFCNYASSSPKELLSKSEKDISDLLMDYVSDLEKNGKAGSYIDSCLKPVRSWLKYNSIILTRPIKVKNAKIPTTLNGQRTPSQEQLRNIILAGTMASRVCISLVSMSGLRLEVLGNYQGNNGLRIGDLPELIINGENIEFEKMPLRIVVKNNLSKAGHEYFSFIGKEGADYIKAYLEERIRKGEKLTKDSPLVIPRNQQIHFITTINIGDQIREAIRKAGFHWRPYDLRHYFATQTLEAESKGTGLIRDYRVFFMGHKGDIEHQYTLNNRTLSNDKIEQMRSAYAKCLRFIETEEKGIKEEDYAKIQRDTAIMIMETAFNIQLTEEQKEELRGIDTNDFQKRLGEIFKDKRADVLNNGNKHKTISERQLEDYLNKGWELVQIYPKGDKAVIKLPS